MAAKCEFCEQEMSPGVGCTVKQFDDFADGVARPRVAYGSETHQGMRMQFDLQEGKGFEVWGTLAGVAAPTTADELVAALNIVQAEFCPDCAVAAGQMHHPGCDVEECPQCRFQAFGCDCITSAAADRSATAKSGLTRQQLMNKLSNP